MKNETYEEFVSKFDKSCPKTTDDCYTPKDVYYFVRDYFVKRFDLHEKRIVRPFYPGGDYEKEDYSGAVVIDNPPFSIMTKIVKFYQQRNIPFVMFCSFAGTTQKYGDLTYFRGCGGIKYENGAKINTVFVTNICSEYAIVCDPVLIEGLAALQKKNKTERKHKKHDYNVVSLTRLPGKELYILKEEITGKGETYGVGYTVTEEAAKRFHEARGDY